MGEWSPFTLSELDWEVLQLYLKHGYGECKLYNTTYFMHALNDKTVLMTLEEFANEAVDYDGRHWKLETKTNK